MDICQWLIVNKEIIMLMANIASVVVMIFVGIAFILSLKEFRFQKNTSQASMFHNITKEINSHLKEEIAHIDEKGEKRESYENWLDRLLGLFEYYAYFVNRKAFPKDMSEYYSFFIGYYCKEAKKHEALIEEIKYLKAKNVYGEIRKYYKNYIKEECPF